MRLFPSVALLLAAGCATSAQDGSDSSSCEAGTVLKSDGYCHPLADGDGPRPLNEEGGADENGENADLVFCKKKKDHKSTHAGRRRGNLRETLTGATLRIERY